MKVQQAIEQLRSVAEKLPKGLDSEFRVAMCDGSNMQVSDFIEIDHLAEVSAETVALSSIWVIVKGHPHEDEREGRTTVMRGVANDADEHLRRWSDDESE